MFPADKVFPSGSLRLTDGGGRPVPVFRFARPGHEGRYYGFQFGEGFGGEFPPDREDDIDPGSEFPAVQPEVFPDETLDPVAPDGLFYSVDAYSQPGIPSAVVSEDDGDVLAPSSSAPAVDPLILRRAAQKQPLGQGEIRPAAAGGGIGHTARRLRPLARRRLITARPLLVLILIRKPWVRCLLVLLG